MASTPSTQTLARARYDGDPVLVVADSQTEGRGRTGNDWVTAPRAVAASLVTAVSWPLPDRSPIPLVAGLAALEHLPDGVDLEWPNDLAAADGKVGGILVESDGGTVVAGIGINLWWPEPIPGAAGLYQDDPGPDEGERFAGRWAASLLARMRRGPGEWGRDEYAARCATLGRTISWEPDGSGRAVGIGGDGTLMVDVGGEIVNLHSGLVRTVRPA